MSAAGDFNAGSTEPDGAQPDRSSMHRIVVERSFDTPQSDADMKLVADRERALPGGLRGDAGSAA